MDHSIWDLFGLLPWHFFGNLGEEYVAGGAQPPSGPFSPDSQWVSESSTTTSQFLHEVQTGWRMETILDFWGPFYFTTLFFTLIVLTGITYCAVRILQIRREERIALTKAVHPIAAQDISRAQLKWDRILDEIQSEDERQWRIAILEADIMLNDLLDVLGYKGETMAEKMKQADVSEFNTIDFAWEAHKIRNRVAHEGIDHPLTASEARRVIHMYERVFREFKYID